MDDFKEQCRRGLKRSLEDRFKYGFFRSYKPILDDVPNRVFETMQEYREWADANLPRYLGYKLASRNESDES